jgi:hypothetical protein
MCSKACARSGGIGMKRYIMLLGLLAACGTPQERCIATGTRDLRILDRLSAEVEANITRGYALEEVTLTRERWVWCHPAIPATETEPAQPAEMCLRETDYTETRPKAINLADEREKLAEMRKKRVELDRQAAQAVALCKRTHPE